MRFDPVGSKIYVVIDTIKKNHSLRIPEYPLLKVSATISTVMRDNETFEKYGIDYAIVENNEIINTYISADEKYEKVYDDETFSIYMKK